MINLIDQSCTPATTAATITVAIASTADMSEFFYAIGVDDYGVMDNNDIGCNNYGVMDNDDIRWMSEGEGEGEKWGEETDELLNLPPYPPEMPYCTHHMMKKLGKSMWDDIALQVPQIQQNGYLNEPKQKGWSSTVASSQTSNALAIKFNRNFPTPPLLSQNVQNYVLLQ